MSTLGYLVASQDVHLWLFMLKKVPKVSHDHEEEELVQILKVTSGG